ncbi:MAG: TRAP transporter large permease subunit [Chloroflexota bacterium]
MSGTTVFVIALVIFLVLIFLRMPVGFALFLAGIAGYWYLDGFDTAMSTLSTVPYRLATTYVFTCLPPFVLMGEIGFRSGLSADAYGMAKRWLGHFRGGLAITTIAASAMFSAITGSSIACALTMTNISLPEMKAAGYDDRLSTGTIATGAILGPMIPPSTIFIIYAFLTETNLGDLLIGGIVPGIVLSIIYMVTIAIWVRVSPSIATAGPHSNWKERITGFPAIWGIGLVFLAVIGGIYAGIFTPTEAASIGVVAVLAVALIRRKLSGQDFYRSLLSTGRTTGTIIMLFIGVYVFNAFTTLTRIPYLLGDTIAGTGLPPWGIMGLIILMYVIAGFFMDCMAVVFVTVPILYPLVIKMGFDPIWFGVMICLLAGLGAITPPYGIIVFAIRGVARDIPMWTIFRGCFPFIYANIAGIILLCLVPPIAYWLPYLFKPG